MSLLWNVTECRAGVVGIYAAGKTVFLTSLINHLRDHDPARFAVGPPGTVIRRFRELPPDPGWRRFDYEANRDALVTGHDWPRKTPDRSMFACEFARSDWTNAVRLRLYDLPGERIADAVMANRGYDQWSDFMLGRLGESADSRQAAAEFLALLDAGRPAEPDLHLAYRLALARLIHAFKPYVSPSVFFLNMAGQVARGTPEEMAARNVVGLDALRQFVPLSAAARARLPELVGPFRDRYNEYRREIVLPFVAALRACHALVVLVDVTMLLAGGTGMYDDNRLVLADLLDVLAPGESPVGSLGRWLSEAFLPPALQPAWITRVAFAAPKLDTVHPLDRDRMVALLRRMLGRTADRNGLRPLFTNCSAVLSARPFPGEPGRVLLGSPLRGSDGRKLPAGADRRLEVSSLPDDWPAHWPPPAYYFPEVHPRMPPRRDCPPDQVHLDQIVTFLLG